MRPMPASQVVLTDDDVAAQIRARVAAENIGQPQSWIDDAAKTEIDKALADRAALRATRQAEYDLTPPATPYVPTEPT